MEPKFGAKFVEQSPSTTESDRSPSLLLTGDEIMSFLAHRFRWKEKPKQWNN